jgi:FMN phosphatase YigB (HAD superfamily)
MTSSSRIASFRVIAKQAGAHKPFSQIFHHASKSHGISMEDPVQICASPHLDLAAARELGSRTVWIDRGTGRKPLADYHPNEIVPALNKKPAILAAVGWMER